MLRALTGRKETRADRRRSENLWTDELGILGWCTSKYKRTVWGLAASFPPPHLNFQKQFTHSASDHRCSISFTMQKKTIARAYLTHIAASRKASQKV